MIKVKILPISRLRKFKEFDEHEALYSMVESESGLNGFVAIHKTNGGHAIGGTRYFTYKNEDEAIRDALNLSRAMTYKCAIAGIRLGGGKAVIMASQKGKSTELIDAYARAINSLNGLFRTGEDVGINEDDARKMGEVSKYILGLPDRAGDPSPWAALSVFHSISAALHHKFGDDAIERRTFAIKGVGKVGAELVRLLYDRGGEIIIADIDRDKAQRLLSQFVGVRAVSSEDIHKAEVDVYAPCAMGGEFDAQSVTELNCKIVCGSANNQLVERDVGQMFHERGIVYIPDYLANAGGLINVADELHPSGYDRERVKSNILAMRGVADRVLSLSLRDNRPTNEISDKYAEDIFRARI